MSHPIGCPGYKRPTSPYVNDSRTVTCHDLQLTTLECNLPFCPDPNDNVTSGLNTNFTKSRLLTADVIRKNGTQIQFECANTSKGKFVNDFT